jgi:hypothetical protein
VAAPGAAGRGSGRAPACLRAALVLRGGRRLTPDPPPLPCSAPQENQGVCAFILTSCLDFLYALFEAVTR